MLPRTLYRLLSPAGNKGQLSIFIFHRVLLDADPLLPFEPSAEQFTWMARYFARTYNVLPLGEAVCRLQAGTLPAAAATITFDDGYADNFQVAWPILQRYALPATFFIATAFLNGGRMWNDDIIETVRVLPPGEFDLGALGLGTHNLSDTLSRIRCYQAVLGKLKYFEHSQRTDIARQIALRAGLPAASNLMMTRMELQTLMASGAEIGAHTHTHPILERLPDTLAYAEIEQGKCELESILGSRVHVFAYPNGAPKRDWSDRHATMVKQIGFEAAVTTEPRFAHVASAKIFQLPRFTPWDRSPLRFAARNLMELWRGRHASQGYPV